MLQCPAKRKTLATDRIFSGENKSGRLYRVS